MFTPGVSSRAIRVSACVITCRESNLDSGTACTTWEKRHTHEASIEISHESPNRAKDVLQEPYKRAKISHTYIYMPPSRERQIPAPKMSSHRHLAGPFLTMWPSGILS